jgi:hypothetical protein
MSTSVYPFLAIISLVLALSDLGKGAQGSNTASLHRPRLSLLLGVAGRWRVSLLAWESTLTGCMAKAWCVVLIPQLPAAGNPHLRSAPLTSTLLNPTVDHHLQYALQAFPHRPRRPGIGTKHSHTAASFELDLQPVHTGLSSWTCSAHRSPRKC